MSSRLAKMQLDTIRLNQIKIMVNDLGHRKAKMIIDIQCSQCGGEYEEKVYELPHKCRCTRCGLSPQADGDWVLGETSDDKTVMDEKSLMEWSLTRDLADRTRGTHWNIHEHGISPNMVEEVLKLEPGALGHRKGGIKPRSLDTQI